MYGFLVWGERIGENGFAVEVPGFWYFYRKRRIWRIMYGREENGMEMLKRFYTEEDGMGTVELVMIIAALMCIALLFRDQISKFAGKIMKTVFDDTLVTGPSAPDMPE